jgi:hypothetical protein
MEIIKKEEVVGAPVDGVEEEKKPKATRTATPAAAKEKAKSILKNTSGKEVSEDDYFFEGKVPSGFVGTCGKPVDREDLLDVFNKIFDPVDNFLFYKALDKEVYLVIVPIKNSTTIGEFNNSFAGDFQKHAISFLNEGSVNVDTLRAKLKRIVPFCKFTNK